MPIARVIRPGRLFDLAVASIVAGIVLVALAFLVVSLAGQPFCSAWAAGRWAHQSTCTWSVPAVATATQADRTGRRHLTMAYGRVRAPGHWPGHVRASRLEGRSNSADRGVPGPDRPTAARLVAQSTVATTSGKAADALLVRLVTARPGSLDRVLVRRLGFDDRGPTNRCLRRGRNPVGQPLRRRDVRWPLPPSAALTSGERRSPRLVLSAGLITACSAPVLSGYRLCPPFPPAQKPLPRAAWAPRALWPVSSRRCVRQLTRCPTRGLGPCDPRLRPEADCFRGAVRPWPSRRTRSAWCRPVEVDHHRPLVRSRWPSWR